MAFLITEFSLSVNEWTDKDGQVLYVLNYNQIESPKNHPITNECRSLVVTRGGDSGWFVVSRSFDRFFNYGETQEVHDITNLTAFEKVDGSIVSLFYWKGDWLYRTRSMIMPTSSVNGWDITWKDLIEPVLLTRGFYEYFHNMYNTYIFEVVGRENRVVTRYAESAAYLLAVRCNLTGNYIQFSKGDAELRGWKAPKSYQFKSFEDCLVAAKELRELNEGYVLYDQFGEPKIKVKNPAYVAAHHLRGEGLNPKRIMQLVIMNEHSEYLAIFPEDTEHFTVYIEKYLEMLNDMQTTWIQNKDIVDQKEFALAVKHLPTSGVLFKARKSEEGLLHCFNSFDESFKIKCLTNYVK
jgi:T4 RnlA family RNA ligase